MIEAEENFAALDWRGAPLDCEACENRELMSAGRCKPAHSCVFDRYAKRVDRFFRLNTTMAGRYVDHPYFEVRAIIARWVNVFDLQRLAQDTDETVRLSAAMRLPQGQLLKLKDDPDREVRIRVVQRIAPKELTAMMHDPDYYVRKVVARRMPAGMLRFMANDPDFEVRAQVALRADEQGLLALCKDSEAQVRILVAQRLREPLLKQMADDEDWRVRFEVAQRTEDRELLARLAQDGDCMVCEVAGERLGSPAAVKDGSSGLARN